VTFGFVDSSQKCNHGSMPPTSNSAVIAPSSRSIGELTNAALGRELSMTGVLELVESISIDDVDVSSLRGGTASTWIGSVGYERYRSVEDFACLLARAGVERLIDVRELPISRRRGFAKTALAAALAEQEIEYLHLRGMGNPKEFRDLYKSGQVAEGRAGYEQLLVEDRVDDLRKLAETIHEKRSALMCVEHDESVCHREVILAALQGQLGIDLEIARIG
jgi:Domain of unknown function DUF488